MPRPIHHRTLHVGMLKERGVDIRKAIVDLDHLGQAPFSECLIDGPGAVRNLHLTHPGLVEQAYIEVAPARLIDNGQPRKTLTMRFDLFLAVNLPSMVNFRCPLAVGRPGPPFFLACWCPVAATITVSAARVEISCPGISPPGRSSGKGPRTLFVPH